MGLFTPYDYTWVSPAKGLLQIGVFIVAFFGLCYSIKLTYPDVVAAPREFEGGLEKELGGSGAVRVGWEWKVDSWTEILTSIAGKILRGPRALPERGGCGLGRTWACTLKDEKDIWKV